MLSDMVLYLHSKILDDKYRLFVNDESTYETVIKNMQTILGESQFSRNFKNLWGLVLITSKTESLVEILKHHKRVGFNSVQMKFVRSANDEYAINKDSIEKLKGLYDELIHFFIENISKGNVIYLKMILNDNDYFGKIVRRLILRIIIPNRCQAGKNKVSLTANGICILVIALLGILISSWEMLLQKKTIEREICDTNCADRKLCSDCWARFICGGDCFHNSYINTGTILTPDRAYCEIEKHLIELGVVLLCHLNSKYPDIYNILKKSLFIEMKAR